MRLQRQIQARAAALALLSFLLLFPGKLAQAAEGGLPFWTESCLAGQADEAGGDEGWPEAKEAETVNAAYGYKNAPVAMEASYGYDNMAKGGRYLPVYVTLKNQRKEVFNGSLMVKSRESDLDIYEYEYPVALEGEEAVQINLNIPLGLRSDQMYVKLYDSQRDQILQKRLKINIRQDTPELLIGTLSDSQDKLEYLDDVGIRSSTLRTRTCAMVAGSIPQQAAGLDQLDVLLITNYDTRRLNAAQADTIREWVSRGGILLLGTGAAGQEAVEAFLENELEGELSEPKERTVNMGDEFALYGAADVRIPLMTTEVKVKGGTLVLSGDGFPVITSLVRGKGIIAVAAYDFCDIGSFCEEHGYVDKMFTRLLGDERIQELAEYLYDGGNSLYWKAQNMLNFGSAGRLPKISLYAVVIFSYILLAGPGLYFFLKQRGLRRHYGSFVILLSFCCSGMLYLMGSRTRFEGPFFQYASVREYSQDAIVSSTYMNMRTPYNKPYWVDLDSAYDIRPLVRPAGQDYARRTQFTGEEKANVNVRYGTEGPRLSMEDVEVFSPNYFRLEKREENQEHLELTGVVSCFGGKLTGSITNGLGIDLEQGAVLCANHIVLLDSIRAGETVVLDQLPTLSYPVASSFAVADWVAGGYRFEKADLSSKAYMDSLKRSNLLDFYLDNFLSGYQHGARVVAFAADKEQDGFLSDTGYESDGLTMYTALVDTDYQKGNQVYRTLAEFQAEAVNGIYSAKNNTMDGLSPLTLEYSLGQELKIEKLSLVSVSEEFSGNPRYSGLAVFDGDIYFYNYETENFDKMDRGQKEFIGWQLEPYLSSENQITIKYAYDTPQDYTLALSLPVLAVTGSKR